MPKDNGKKGRAKKGLSQTECLALTSVYEQLFKSRAGINDFRAKLLALLPFASGASLVTLTNLQGVENREEHLVAFGVFGALITFALYLHEIRGIHMCGDLDQRIADLERSLGCSQHAGVPPGSSSSFLISSAMAAAVIFSATIALWAYIVLCGLEKIILVCSEPASLLALRVGVAIILFLAVATLGYHVSTCPTRRQHN